MGWFMYIAALAVALTAILIRIRNMEEQEEMDKIKQRRAVLEYMETHGSIDQYRAFTELGCSRLSARIAELKAEGVPIYGEMKLNQTTGKRWKEYRTR